MRVDSGIFVEQSPRIIMIVFLWFILFCWSHHCTFSLPLQAARQPGGTDNKLSPEKTMQIVSKGLNAILNQINSWEAHIDQQQSYSRNFLTENVIYVVQSSQTFGDHIDQCLAQGGYLLSKPHLLLGISDSPLPSLLIATFNTENLLSYTSEQQVDKIASEANSCLLSSFSTALDVYESSSVSCTQYEAPAICLFHSFLGRHEMQAHKYIKSNFMPLARGASDNIQMIKTSFTYPTSHIDDIGLTLKAALALSSKMDALILISPLKMQIFHYMYLLDQYISQIFWLVHNDKFGALNQKSLAWDGMKETKDQVSSFSQQYQADRKTFEVKLQQLRTKFAKQKTLQNNRLQRVEQSLQRIQMSKGPKSPQSLEPKGPNSPQSPELGDSIDVSSPQPPLINGSAQSIDLNGPSDSGEINESSGWDDLATFTNVTEMGFEAPAPPLNVTVWPFTYSIALEDYYRLSFLNFYAATLYAIITAGLTIATTTFSCVRNRRVNKLKKAVDQLQYHQLRRARPPKVTSRRHRVQGQPLLPRRQEIMRAVANTGPS